VPRLESCVLQTGNIVIKFDHHRRHGKIAKIRDKIYGMLYEEVPDASPAAGCGASGFFRQKSWIRDFRR